MKKLEGSKVEGGRVFEYGQGPCNTPVDPSLEMTGMPGTKLLVSGRPSDENMVLLVNLDPTASINHGQTLLDPVSHSVIWIEDWGATTSQDDLTKIRESDTFLSNSRT